MDLGIAAKTAIVTGASAGIGRAIATEFAQNGVNLLLVARDFDRLSVTAKEIGYGFGVGMLPFAADVGNLGEPDRVVASAMERFGESISWSTTLDELVRAASWLPLRRNGKR